MSEHLESAKKLTESLHILFANISLKSVIKWSIALILIAIIGLFIYETFFSSSFYYEKLDKKLEVIETIKKLADGDSLIEVTSNQRLYETLQQLEPPSKTVLKNPFFERFYSNLSPDYLILLLGFLLGPLIVLLITLVQNDYSSVDIFSGMLKVIFLSICTVPLLIFIPIIYSPWINVILTPIFQLIILAFILIISDK